MELRVDAFEIETLESRLEMQVVVAAASVCAGCAQSNNESRTIGEERELRMSELFYECQRESTDQFRFKP